MVLSIHQSGCAIRRVRMNQMLLHTAHNLCEWPLIICSWYQRELQTDSGNLFLRGATLLKIDALSNVDCKSDNMAVIWHIYYLGLSDYNNLWKRNLYGVWWVHISLLLYGSSWGNPVKVGSCDRTYLYWRVGCLRATTDGKCRHCFRSNEHN